MPQLIVVPNALLTVVETNAYLAKAARILSAGERSEIVDTLASDPQCGDVVPGGGGIRKVRFGAKGKGKRGGVRVIYYYHSRRMPLFLLTVFGKNEKSDLSQGEIRQLAKAVKQIPSTYGA